jgi:competence protein ComEA
VGRPGATSAVRKALGAALAVLAALACALLVAAHRLPGAISPSTTVLATRGTDHGAQTAVSWPQGDVDPNTADAEALQALSAVGPTLASAIVTEREANGPFYFPEDLLMVKGIGEKTLQKFEDQLDFSSRSGG